MRWPWSDPETREAQPFTDAVVSALQAQALGVQPRPDGVAALESSANFYARAFGGAALSPADHPAVRALTPSVLAMIGRDLIRRGESVHVIEVSGGGVRLQPAGSWDVRGGPDPDSWWYRADVFGPSGNLTRFVPGPGVVHCRDAVDAARPWYGIGPLGWAYQSAKTAAATETRLGEEASGVVAHILPIPQDGGDGDDDTDPLSQIKADIAGAKGGTVLVETTAAGWGRGSVEAPRLDWRAQRIGADPPEALRELRGDAAMSVLDACGVPRALAESADGTAAREGWRRFIMGAVEPLLTLTLAELSDKLDVTITADLTTLWAHDLAGRASAFKSLTAGGLPPAEALVTSGLMADDA